MLLDENKSEVARRLYNAYGETVQETGSWPEVVEFAYQSNWLKLTTLPDGLPLYLSPTRLYEAGTGRFLQRDLLPARASRNQYAYARGNPMLLTDPRGLVCEEEKQALAKAREDLRRSVSTLGSSAVQLRRYRTERARTAREYMRRRRETEAAYQNALLRYLQGCGNASEASELGEQYMAAYSESIAWRLQQPAIERQHIARTTEALQAAWDDARDAASALSSYLNCLWAECREYEPAADAGGTTPGGTVSRPRAERQNRRDRGFTITIPSGSLPLGGGGNQGVDMEGEPSSGMELESMRQTSGRMQGNTGCGSSSTMPRNVSSGLGVIEKYGPGPHPQEVWEMIDEGTNPQY